MRHTICTPAGRLVIQASATRASVQVAFFPTDRSAAPCGFLIPNASAGIAAQALEAVATINEESTPPELSALAPLPEVLTDDLCHAYGVPYGTLRSELRP